MSKMKDSIKLSEYRDWLRNLKQQIKTGQMKQSVRIASFGRKTNTTRILHSVRNATNHKYIITN
jgi:hypothetical protein